MSRFVLLFVALLSAAVLADKRTVFECDFEKAMAVESEAGKVVAGFGRSQSLLVERVDRGSETRRFAIGSDKFTDRFATLRAVVKAEGVSDPPNSWNGIKVMLVLETESGARQYPQIQMPTGTFDWRQMTQTIRIPGHVKSA